MIKNVILYLFTLLMLLMFSIIMIYDEFIPKDYSSPKEIEIRKSIIEIINKNQMLTINDAGFARIYAFCVLGPYATAEKEMVKFSSVDKSAKVTEKILPYITSARAEHIVIFSDNIYVITFYFEKFGFLDQHDYYCETDGSKVVTYNKFKSER